MVEDAPPSVRQMLRRGWLSLGLKRGPLDDPGYVLGWKIRRSTPDYVLVGSDSRVGMPAELLLERRENDLLFSTMIRFGNPLVRLTWIPVTALHQETVSRLLGRISP